VSNLDSNFHHRNSFAIPASDFTIRAPAGP